VIAILAMLPPALTRDDGDSSMAPLYALFELSLVLAAQIRPSTRQNRTWPAASSARPSRVPGAAGRRRRFRALRR
jgi:hypothetical protein